MNTPTKTLRTFIALACLVCSAGVHAALDCGVNSAALTFPPYDTSSIGPTDSVGVVDITCRNLGAGIDRGSSVAMSLGAGTNGSVSDRKMAGTSDLLHYGIYSDAGHTINWGQGMDAVQQFSGPFSPNETKRLQFVLFGRIPALQNVHAGSYQDQVVLTITP